MEQVSAIKLQQYARRFITRSKYLKQLKLYHEKRNVSTVLIQSIMRMYLMKCQYIKRLQQYKKRRKSSIKIQAALRRYLCFQTFLFDVVNKLILNFV